MTARSQPRYLTHTHAAILKEDLEIAVRTIRRRMIEEGAEPRGLDHELGIALARAACRQSIDPLPVAATTAIERLEVCVSELEARLEQAKIATTYSRAPTLPPEPIKWRFVLDGLENGIAAAAKTELANLFAESDNREDALREAEHYFAGNGYAVSFVEQFAQDAIRFRLIRV